MKDLPPEVAGCLPGLEAIELGDQDIQEALDSIRHDIEFPLSIEELTNEMEGVPSPPPGLPQLTMLSKEPRDFSLPNSSR